jgi:hypothetical protein
VQAAGITLLVLFAFCLFKDVVLALSFPLFFFFLALSALLILPILVLLSGLIQPAVRNPEASYSLSLKQFALQQWLMLISLVLLAVVGMLYLPDFSIGFWLCWGILLTVLAASFWVRAVDLAQAIRGIHWNGARKRSRHLKGLLWLQISASIGLIVTGLTFSVT